MGKTNNTLSVQMYGLQHQIYIILRINCNNYNSNLIHDCVEKLTAVRFKQDLRSCTYSLCHCNCTC